MIQQLLAVDRQAWESVAYVPFEQDEAPAASIHKEAKGSTTERELHGQDRGVTSNRTVGSRAVSGPNTTSRVS